MRNIISECAEGVEGDIIRFTLNLIAEFDGRTLADFIREESIPADDAAQLYSLRDLFKNIQYNYNTELLLAIPEEIVDWLATEEESLLEDNVSLSNQILGELALRCFRGRTLEDFLAQEKLGEPARSVFARIGCELLEEDDQPKSQERIDYMEKYGIVTGEKPAISLASHRSDESVYEEMQDVADAEIANLKNANDLIEFLKKYNWR